MRMTSNQVSYNVFLIRVKNQRLTSACDPSLRRVDLGCDRGGYHELFHVANIQLGINKKYIYI
jgi:hypothetical protein